MRGLKFSLCTLFECVCKSVYDNHIHTIDTIDDNIILI